MFDTKHMILPTPAAGFEWRYTPDGPALVCLQLAEWARHLFSTRQWTIGRGASPQGDEGWLEVARALGVDPDRLSRVRQVHGNRVVIAPGCDEQTPADIILNADPGRAIAVQSADCVPLLVADVRLGMVAAAHAGWRGLASRVPALTVRAMTQAWGSLPHDLIAAAGPSIGACCYEVGRDVREAFVAGGFDARQIREWFNPAPSVLPGNPPMSGLSRASRPDRWFFDGWASTQAQLREAGVPADRIFIASLCTASHPGLLCSYRRDGSPAGRLVAAIRAATTNP